MEDVRRRGERSYPRQRMHEGDKIIPADLFNHAVFIFLHGYMKFENNFIQFNFNRHQDNAQIEPLSPSLIASSEESKLSHSRSQGLDEFPDGLRMSLLNEFAEDDFKNFDSHAYIIQDCDLFFQILLDIKRQGIPKELPTPMEFYKNTLMERHAVVVFQLLDSLKKDNIMRLLERRGSTGKTWSTRKNLRDLIGSINEVLINSKFEFK